MKFSDSSIFNGNSYWWNIFGKKEFGTKTDVIKFMRLTIFFFFKITIKSIAQRQGGSYQGFWWETLAALSDGAPWQPKCWRRPVMSWVMGPSWVTDYLVCSLCKICWKVSVKWAWRLPGMRTRHTEMPSVGLQAREPCVPQSVSLSWVLGWDSGSGPQVVPSLFLLWLLAF